MLAHGEYYPLVLAAALVLPLVAALVVPWRPVARARNLLTVATPLVSFLLLCSLYPPVMAGHPLTLAVSGLGTPQGLTLTLDIPGLTAALLASFVWVAASLCSGDYLAQGQHQGRFASFLLISLTAILGVFLAADLLTLLLFFEVLTIGSYVLVVHNQDNAALIAGRLYLFLGVGAGLAVLAAISLMSAAGLPLILNPGVLLQAGPTLQIVVAALFFLGFGIKAGMVPLHLWLQEAHPVAPAPASALLSGIMIKGGAFGVFRTLTLFFPVTATQGWLTASTLGLVVLCLGIVTMVVGVTMALLQENLKRMLACHSISQMGYILVGLGAAAYLGTEGSMGLTAAFYHLINHGLFKAALFLTAGVVYLKTHDLNMYHLGGLWKRLPFTTVVALVAALGISGFPGLNGYASKTLLHHALSQAAHHGPPSLVWAERLFVLTGAGTTASMLKLLWFTYFQPPTRTREIVPGEGRFTQGGLSILAIAMIAIGFSPQLLLRKLLIPATAQYPFSWEVIEHELLHIHFFDLTNLIGVGVSLSAGLLLFLVGTKTGLFHLHPPKWISIGYLTGVSAGACYHQGCQLWAWIGERQTQVSNWLGVQARRIQVLLTRLDTQPGTSRLLRQICIGNISFDVLVVILLLATLLFLYTPSIIWAGGL